MDNQTAAPNILALLDAYEKTRLRDAWTLAGFAWLTWAGVMWSGIGSDFTSGVFMGVSIVALARALQAQTKRSPEDQLLELMRRHVTRHQQPAQ
ncbi:MAG: hypothetical protein QNJ19_07385 [Woeseiaceae bacterium]|nr:hypothetical protein [Woeseiaceae bacterium]